MTSSISPPSNFDLEITSDITLAPNSHEGMFFSDFPKDPTAVLDAAVIIIFFFVIIRHYIVDNIIQLDFDLLFKPIVIARIRKKYDAIPVVKKLPEVFNGKTSIIKIMTKGKA